MSFWVKYGLLMMFLNWVVAWLLCGFLWGFDVLNWWSFILGFGCAVWAMWNQYQENVKHDNESLRILREDRLNSEVSQIDKEFDDRL